MARGNPRGPLRETSCEGFSWVISPLGRRDGRVWLKAADSKSVVHREVDRGFESLSLRQGIERENGSSQTERCPRWPKGHDWKSCVHPKGVPRVRIPLSPPRNRKGKAEIWGKRGSWNGKMRIRGWGWVDRGGSWVLCDEGLPTPSGPEGSSGRNLLGCCRGA